MTSPKSFPFLVFIDARGEGAPAFQCLVESENEVGISAALRVLKKIAPEACRATRVLLTDISHVFVNSWKSVINSNVKISISGWHLQKK